MKTPSLLALRLIGTENAGAAVGAIPPIAAVPTGDFDPESTRAAGSDVAMSETMRGASAADGGDGHFDSAVPGEGAGDSLQPRRETNASLPG